MNACMELYFSIFKRLAESGGGGYSNLARRVIDEGEVLVPVTVRFVRFDLVTR